MTVLSFAASCSKDSPKYGIFQNNTGSTDPLGGGGSDPFAGYPDFLDPTTSVVDPQTFVNAFDPTGGLYYLNFDPTAYEIFAQQLEAIRTADHAHHLRIDDVLGLLDVLANTSPNAVLHKGIYGLMEYLGLSMGYLMNQNTLDDTTGTDYQGNLYTFINKIIDANLNMKTDVYNVMYKILDFLADRTWRSGTLESNMVALRQFLSDATGQTFTGLLFTFQEGIGKLLLRADSYIQHDDPQDAHAIENTGLGNAVSGIDFLLTGITDMISTNNTYDGPAVRQNLYDILREVGALLNSPSFKASNYAVLTNLLKNIENYFTLGGANLSAEYRNTSNPYVNAELRNTVKEIWPTLAKLFIREQVHPDYSLIKTGGARSPIELLTRSLHMLKDAGIDYSNTTDYSLEPSLKNLVKYNAYGEDRATAAYKVSYLDHLLFTCAASYNFGYLTRGSCSGEPYNNLDHGHGRSTKGVLTVNDTMYSLTNREMGTTAGNKDSYNLALDIRTWQGDRIWRAYTYFTNAQRSGKEFYLGKDFPALCLLPSGCIGDVGIPNGGIKALTPSGDDTSGNDYKTYFPYAADGKGIGNTTNWMMSWVARVCWDGAGPYYSTQGAYLTNNAGNGSLPDWPGKGSTNYWVYFKPNGEVYAYVDKNPATWLYYYPATGNDVVDTKAVNDPYDSSLEPNGQRFNRYRCKLISDYFLLLEGDTAGSYSAPPMNARGVADSLVENSNPADHRAYHLTVSGARQPHYIRLFEKLQEARQADNAKRECATHEIAMYRNFQWLMLEKKFVFAIPMIIRAGMLTCWINANAMVVMEANGFLGQANIKKYGNSSTNGYWVLRGDRGDLSQSDGVTSNIPDYGDSSYRGDARIIVFAKPDEIALTGDRIDPEVVWDNVLGNAAATSGYVLPDVIGRNLAPALNMAFPTQDCRGPNMGTGGGTNFQNTIASDSTAIGDNGQAIWQNRSKIFPILVALFGVLMDGSYYEPAGSGGDYNYSGTAHKYPLLDVLEGLMIPLSKPLMRYYTESESYTGGSASRGRWVPRLNAEPTINGQTRFDYFQPIMSGGVDYRPRSVLRTVPSFLADQTTGTYYDGLISILADNTRIVTKLVSLLQRMGDYDGAGSPYRDVADGGNGILENVSKGLEQIITSVQVDRSEASATGRSWLGYNNTADETRYDSLLNNNRFGWMFWDVNNRRAGTPISVDLGVLLDELIGDNTTKGISKFVDNHETPTDGSAGAVTDNAKWANYFTALDALGEMLGNPASKWYMLADEANASSPFYPTSPDYEPGNLINFVNKILTGVTTIASDRQALRHTLGIMMYRYANGTGPWTVNTELRDILQLRLPETMVSFEGHYGNLLLTLQDMMDWDFDYATDRTVDQEIMDYLIDLLIPGTRAEEVIPKLYDLVSSQSSWDPGYYISTPGYALWKQLADIADTLINKLPSP
jgi:hypothetical protein